MQTAPAYRTNRDLFSNHYLDERLPETESWDAVSEDELRAVYEDISDLWEREKSTAPKRNGSQLEQTFIRPLFRKLGIPFEIGENTDSPRRSPDYGFFDSEATARDALDRREAGGDFYENAVAVADTKRWGRPLDTRGSGEHERDFENPGYRIHVYLQETPARWAVLTDGKKWRLYCAQTSHRLDSYYEIDLPTVLENGDLKDFKYFYLFFRHGAFLENGGGDSFLDDVYDESSAFARELRETLQDNVHEAIEVLAEGFFRHPDGDPSENDLDEGDLGEDDLDLVYDSSLVYLYRLIFVLYAESEGRDLLDTTNEVYEQSYSLHSLKREVAEELDGSNPKYRDRQDDLQSRLDELFVLVDRGSESLGIPEEDLYVPPYDGWLFRTAPDDDDSREARFLAEHEVGDACLARVVELLTRSESADGGGKHFVDYSSFDVRHLGSIYEGLLECELNVAAEPLALDGGTYVSATEADDVVAQAGELYLTTGSGKRKLTGSYYTPEYVVEYVVENALEPLVDEVWTELAGERAFGEDDFGGDSDFAEAFARKIFDFQILDPAMGSGHFLTRTVDYLARKIIDAQETQAANLGVESIDQDHDVGWARRQVAQRCIYGVDRNPLAVELAKASLWLRTTGAEQPFAFLDHRLKTGNSLIGSGVEEIEELDPEIVDIAHRSSADQEFADDNEMEARDDEFERNELRRRLEAVTNVHTADTFGSSHLPADAHERMAAALEDDEQWTEVEKMRWFRDAQRRAKADRYFHWELEYPDVFYDAPGEMKTESGFDAVIGNPPYVRSRNLPDARKEFYKNRYRSAEGLYDVYIPFLERAAELGDRSSFVVPNKWTTTNYGEALRELLLDTCDLDEVVDVSRLGVFADADIYPVIVSYTAGRGDGQDAPTIRRVESERDIGTASGTTVSRDVIDQLGGRIVPVNLTPEFAPIIEKALSQPTKLGDHVEMAEAIHTGNVREKLIVDGTAGSNCERLADGRSIDRYHVEWSGEWIRYDESLINGDHEEYGDLRTRDLFESDSKLFIRDISYRPVAAYDENQLFGLNTLYSVTQRDESDLDLKYLLAIFNSEFVNRYFRQVYGGTHVDGDYLRFKPTFSGNIPVPDPDSTVLHPERKERLREFDSSVDTSSTVETVAQLTDIVRRAKRRKRGLESSLDDVLGEYTDGQTLGKLPGYRAPAGVSDSPVARTASSLENLRAGPIDVSKNRDGLTLRLSARYKPDDEEEFETDRWGYAETELLPAMEFVGLDEIERLLVREFVPYAVEEAGGFAGFRERATKTNSLIDRLEAITLPAIGDVSSELLRYQTQMHEANALDEKIARADELLDEIIYDLYDLTEEEKRIVDVQRE